MKDDKPQNQVMRWAGYAMLFVVGIGVFAFSAANNFSLFAGIFGGGWGYVMAALGLTTLDIAAVGWIVFGVSAAKGLFQRVASWGAGGICLILALVAAVSELIIKQNYIERPDWVGNMAIGSIVVGLVVNAIAIALTHVIDPDTVLSIRVGMQRDEHKNEMANVYLAVLGESVQKAKGKMAAASDSLSEILSKELVSDARRELLGYTPSGDNTPDTKWQPSHPALALGGGESNFGQDQRRGSSFKNAAQTSPTLDATYTFGKSDEPLPNYPTVNRPDHRAAQPPRFEAGPDARPDSFIRPIKPTWHDVPASAIKVEKDDSEFVAADGNKDESPKAQAHQMRR